MNRRTFFTRLAGAIGAIAAWPWDAKADTWKPNPYLTAEQKDRFCRSMGYRAVRIPIERGTIVVNSGRKEGVIALDVEQKHTPECIICNPLMC